MVEKRLMAEELAVDTIGLMTGIRSQMEFFRQDSPKDDIFRHDITLLWPSWQTPLRIHIFRRDTND